MDRIKEDELKHVLEIMRFNDIQSYEEFIRFFVDTFGFSVDAADGLFGEVKKYTKYGYP